MWTLALLACTDDAPPAVFVSPFPAADAHGGTEGPGGPARSFAPGELLAACGTIPGGPGDAEHHNLSVMHDGYLVHPWAPEYGGGGVTFFAFDDPCAPERVGEVWADGMRETHTLAFGEADGREYLAVDYIAEEGAVGGVGFFDITDRTAPFWASSLETPGFFYPDSYLRVTFASFWQGPVVYVAAAFNGIQIVDASDPTEPVLAATYDFEPALLVGEVTVIGNLAIVASAGAQRTVLLDVSDPYDPQPIAGGTFDTTDDEGGVVKYYFSSISGRYGLFARNDRGGGPMIWDLSTEVPTRVGALLTEDGDGGYVYRQGDTLFQGDSNFGVLVDASDPANPVELGRVDIPGDLDTVSPIGNVAVVSVDEGAEPGGASQVFPWTAEPDTDPPSLEWHLPADGATGLATTSRIGLSFDEWVERATVFEGSFRVADERGRAVPGTFNVQESIVNFTPSRPLEPDTTYLVAVPAGGIADLSGNAVDEDVVFSFTTGGAR